MIKILKTLKILGIVAALATAGIACSSSDNGGAVNTPISSGTPSACATPSAEPQVSVSATDELKFDPANITVKPCQLVVWTITGTAPHTVTSVSGATFDSGTKNKGQTFTQAFPTAGTIHYHCTIHPSMTGTITVAS